VLAGLDNAMLIDCASLNRLAYQQKIDGFQGALHWLPALITRDN
jgi:hypothetical protein